MGFFFSQKTPIFCQINAILVCNSMSVSVGGLFSFYETTKFLKGVESLSKKKMLFTVTAGAAIASTLMGTDEAEAASYKVKSGDSLWKIAQSFNTTVSDLKSLNQLSGDLIHPNQVLVTSKTSDKPSTGSSSGSSSSSSATSYTVKSGDTLSGIASKHNISLNNLMKWNNLSTTLIFPGNVFTVSDPGSSSSSPPKNTGNSSSGNATTYVVKSGDTLSHIARAHNVSVSNLKKWNNLRSDLIHIGQKLSLGSGGSGPVTEEPVSSAPPAKHDGFNVDQLIKTANSVIGTPYVWGGQTTSGFDCSGFIHYAYNAAGMKSSRTSTDGYFNRSFYVDKPQVGDLVFFKNTYRSGISHMGIYIGNNKFIHAGSSTGVTITDLSNSYWSKHFDSFKRFY